MARKASDFEFPVNAYAQITGNIEQAEHLKVTPALKAAFRYLLLLVLNERERDVIRLYFELNLTYDEVGKECSISRERVRQIVARSLRKLRYRPEYIALLEGNLSEYILSHGKAKYEEGYNKGFEAGVTRVKAAKDLTEKQEANIVSVGDISLDELFKEKKLSARSYNCLRKIGYETLKEVAAAPAVKLFGEPRNFGRGCANEVTEVLESYGYDTSEHEEILSNRFSAVHRDWLILKAALEEEKPKASTEARAEATSMEERIQTFLSRYRKGHFIFSGVLRRFFGDEAESVAKYLVDNKLAEPDEMIRCPQCDFATSRRSSFTQEEIDEDEKTFCTACDHEFHISEGITSPVLIVL